MSTDELSDVDFLLAGDLTVLGRMPHSSNATLLCSITHAERTDRVIYKPLKGERPLWDFPPGLHRREVAAYRLATSMGFDIVPPTVLRDGPFGEGSVQLFVEHDPNVHYFTLFESREELHDALKVICAFDIVANNTDRKAGHVIVGPDEHVWGIDHGVCFSADFKLRTVIWEFATEELPAPINDAVAGIADTVPLDVAALLSDDERDVPGRAHLHGIVE
ncbi:MAG: SCO1664 family protein, partial [Actinomycetota bacterium]